MLSIYYIWKNNEPRLIPSRLLWAGLGSVFTILITIAVLLCMLPRPSEPLRWLVGPLIIDRPSNSPWEVGREIDFCIKNVGPIGSHVPACGH